MTDDELANVLRRLATPVGRKLLRACVPPTVEEIVARYEALGGEQNQG